MTNAESIAFRRRRLSARFEKALLYGLFGLLLFGPLAFGAVEPWSIFFFESGAAVLLLGWVGKQALDGKMTVRWNPIFAPMLTFGALIATQLTFRRSAYPHDTMTLAMQYLAYATLCFLATQTLLRGAQARSLALIFSIYGAVLAVFALVQGISSNGRLYWLRLPHNGGWIYGPYVNHNHYAGLMEMLAPIPIIVALSHIAPHNLRIAAGACAAVMVGTIFLSGSRGGMLAIVAELIFLAVLLVQQRLVQQERGVRTAIGMGAFLAIVVGLIAWIGGGELARRIASVGPGHSEITADIRSYINHDCLRMFLQRPILGWGLGSFPAVYPQFRTFYTNFFVNQAHDDYLQLLVEMGGLGLATMLWFVGTLYRRGFKKISNWESDISGALALSCLLGVTGILIHSAVDFNLEIPANAALFYVFCAVASADAFVKPARKRRAVHSEPPQEIADAREAVQQSAMNY